ncbi:hypothetical protein ABPG74_019098 [Tetrahymena malaccensis]
MSELVLGYWGVPLRGQPIRYLLELGKQAYQDKIYSNRDEWFQQDKLNLGLDFPNLPYLIHGDVKLTESQNIVAYVIELTKQTNLLGADKTKFKIQNVVFFCNDLIPQFMPIFMKQGEERTQEIEKVLPKIKLLEKDLNKKTHFFNNTLSLADVYVYCVLDAFEQLGGDSYKPFEESFKPFLEAFRSIPEIKAYIESGRCPKFQQ